jgi:N-acyl-D-aspartate/D-glutamate deacylase
MPRFLGHYSRDLQLLDLAQAVRKITSLPAQREHLTGRGLLKSGFYADVTIFDPAAIIDTATYAVPNQVAKGVQYVLVNGQLEWEQGKLTGATAGPSLLYPVDGEVGRQALNSFTILSREASTWTCIAWRASAGSRLSMARRISA